MKNQIPEPVAAITQKGIPAQHNPRRLKVLHAADVIRMQVRQKEVAYLLRLNAVRHELILNLIRRAHRGRIQQIVEPSLKPELTDFAAIAGVKEDITLSRVPD